MPSTILFITGLLFLGLSTFNSLTRNTTPISKISTAIFTVAGGTYLIMACMVALGDPTPIRILRYIDWFITVPLMIAQLGYFFTGGFKLKRAIIPMILALSMLGVGLAGELGFNPEWGVVRDGQLLDLRQHEYKQVLGMIGIGIMFNLFISLAKCIDPKHLLLFLSIFGLWAFYPIVYFLPESGITLIGYSLVDIAAKVGIGFLIDRKYEQGQCYTNI